MALFERHESNRSNVSGAPSMVTSQTGTSDSMSSFDRSSYLVVKSTGSSSHAKTPLRKRSGSFGELQPDREPSQWDFKATFDDTPVEDRNVIMMERYNSPRNVVPKKQLTGKDFMDGTDFLESTNLFRDSYTSQRWNTDLFEQPSHSFETHRPQEDDIVTDDLDHLFQELHVSLTQGGKTGLHHQQPLHHDEGKEQDQRTIPTTPTTEPTTTPSSSLPSNNDLLKESKKENKKKKHKKRKSSKRRSSRLPSVVPPKEIDVSDCITVASSIGGGLSPTRQRPIKIPPSLLTLSEEKEVCLPRTLPALAQANTPAREVDISAPMTVASSIGQESAWNNPAARRLPKSPRVIDISGQMTVQSSLGAESILRQEKRTPLNLDKVKSKSLEIDVSDPTVVSSLGESVDRRRRMNYQALVPERPQDCYYPSLHHQLYSSHLR